MEQLEPKIVRLFVLEEQEIYREVYKSIFPSSTPIELIEVSENRDIVNLSSAVAKLRPDVVLLSTKRLDINIIEELEQIRTDYPQVGIVLLLLFCSVQDIDLLRRLALRGAGGMALFLKHSLDQVDQFCNTILAVSHGQVILDPPLATYMFAGKPECPFLKQLTTRELEILGLLSKGYTNLAIAQTLFIDIKTVEHHLNSLYSKLKTDPDFNNKHLRVSAARLYLKTMNDLCHRENLLVNVGANR